MRDRARTRLIRAGQDLIGAKYPNAMGSRVLAYLIAFMLVPVGAAAHHSRATFFDMDRIVELEGEITRVQWRHPHVRYWLQADPAYGGAEHFQYVLRGEATVYLNETPRRLRAGDLLYKYDRERHYCENDGSGELVFVEFFVPGEYETVWADPERRCAWSPTGKNALGGQPSRHIATHTSDGSYHRDV